MAGAWRENLVVSGFSGLVRQVAFSPDGAVLATVGKDGVLKFWDAFSGDERPAFARESVCCVAFSLNGKLVSGGEGSLTIWDPKSGNSSELSERHSITSLAFSPDGKWVAFAERNKGVWLWNGAPGGQTQSLGSSTDEVDSMAFSPDGRLLAIGANDKTARVWKVEDGTELFDPLRTEAVVKAVAFSQDGARLAVADDTTVSIVDSTTGKPLNRLPVPAEGICCLAFSSNGELAIAGREGTVRIRKADGQLSFRAHNAAILSLAFSADGTRLATGSEDKTARIWNTGLTHELRTFEAHSEAVTGLALSPDGTKLLSTGKDGMAKVWDAYSGKQLWTMQHGEEIFDGVLDQDAAFVATAGLAFLKIWKTSDAALTHTHQFNKGGSLLCVKFGADGRELGGAIRDAVFIWDVLSGDEKFRLKVSAPPVAIALSPDKMRLAWADREGKARVADRTSKEVIFEHYVAGISDLAFSPDSKRLAAASQDKTAKLWDIALANQIASLEGHDAGLVRILFDPDGDRLATTSSDGTARIWDVPSGHPLVNLPGHTGTVTAVAFHPDHRQVITAGVDKTIRSYTLDADELVTIVLERLLQARQSPDVDPRLMRTLQARLEKLKEERRAENTRLRVNGLLRNAENLAVVGEWHSAKDLFTDAQGLDGTLEFRPEELARELATSHGIEYLIDQATDFAKRGDQAHAQETFKQAVKLDHDLGSTHSAQLRIVQFWKAQGKELIRSLKIPDAKRAYDAAQEFDQRSISGAEWNDMCWQGSLRGFPEQVKDACDKAVLSDPFDPNNAMYRDSRAVNLALRGHPEDAIRDFEAFVPWTQDARKREQRKGYIEKLKRKPPENPLTPAEIASLLPPAPFYSHSQKIQLSGDEGRCYSLVQGKIAWDYEDHKTWADQNVRRLCASTASPTQPPRCFDWVMHGGLDPGKGIAWTWPSALELCAGTNDADATIACFQARIRRGDTLSAAVPACKRSTVSR